MDIKNEINAVETVNDEVATIVYDKASVDAATAAEMLRGVRYAVDEFLMGSGSEAESCQDLVHVFHNLVDVPKTGYANIVNTAVERAIRICNHNPMIASDGNTDFKIYTLYFVGLTYDADEVASIIRFMEAKAPEGIILRIFWFNDSLGDMKKTDDLKEHKYNYNVKLIVRHMHCGYKDDPCSLTKTICRLGKLRSTHVRRDIIDGIEQYNKNTTGNICASLIRLAMSTKTDSDNDKAVDNIARILVKAINRDDMLELGKLLFRVLLDNDLLDNLINDLLNEIPVKYDN